jgi:hypothetical protein
MTLLEHAPEENATSTAKPSKRNHGEKAVEPPVSTVKPSRKNGTVQLTSNEKTDPKAACIEGPVERAKRFLTSEGQALSGDLRLGGSLVRSGNSCGIVTLKRF